MSALVHDELRRALADRAASGRAGTQRARLLAAGEGWRVEDVLCTCGPGDPSSEEQHPGVAIGLVVAGSFEYHASGGRALMVPGSLLFGGGGEGFECTHHHGAGDRCVAFRYEPAVFDAITGIDIGSDGRTAFATPRLPPVPTLSSLAARTAAGLASAQETDWEELAIEVAGTVVGLLGAGGQPLRPPPAAAASRVSRVVRAMAEQPLAGPSLEELAARAHMSRFHFLRTFQQVTGVTPHQYLLRMRLREAAARLLGGEERILDVALGCGFGDLSNFNRAFRAEVGMTPRAYRRDHGSVKARARASSPRRRGP